ncbi:GNAT family N-acetyltransferase [Micromonospora endolithica]|uniref:GNAT family N-acetyltransferase n=1 Tax=Micromonospora endolithica TaxID=230091 RepID=A0A3A9ZLL6_9ACTN|nr:GNAT family N-acetyltransferase [Micromonospora endolithica]RKN49085.1 GNAT family N-acetyltransferase [Micromonospora endolithica]TWJ23236.1 ribosomal protein S18 acetylase RimI-like enzyme [Micromonospora endolithica]
MTLWRIRATVDDRPGYLSVLTASLALRGVNILTVQVHTTERGAVDDFLVDAPDTLDEADLVAAVERGRGRDCWVARSEARGLADQPTRVLGLANRLVRDPDATGEALRALLGADAVTWRPAPAGSGGGIADTNMSLADPGGGSYALRRAAPGFTPAEYARAQALVELAATVARRAVEHVTLVLPDGAEVGVRPAVADDLAGVGELHERCSAGARHRRYLGGASVPSPARLRRLLEPARGSTLLATATGSDGAAESVVAMANLLAEGDEAEVALLVRDDWQRRGLGSALLRRLVRQADTAGYAALVLHVQADNAPMLRTLRRLGRPTVAEYDGGLATLTVPLVANTPVPERTG